MAIIKYTAVFAITNMKRTLKSHLRQKYELRKDHTIFLLNLSLMSRHFLKKDSYVSHELQIFLRVIIKIGLFISCFS